MALGPRLDLRQTQSLVMTPQLQQAIKLLAASNLEIETFIGEALEANPLLEAGEVSSEATEPLSVAADEPSADTTMTSDEGALDLDPGALDRDRDTGDAEWGAAAPTGSTGENLPGIDERGGDGPTLTEHLEAQVGAAAGDARDAAIARHLIGLLD